MVVQLVAYGGGVRVAKESPQVPTSVNAECEIGKEEGVSQTAST